MSAQPENQASAAENVSETKSLEFDAHGSPGEVSFKFVGNAAADAATSAIPSPLKVIGASIKSFGSSLSSLFKNPKKLIPAIVLAVLWLAIGIIQAAGWNPVPVKIISFLTFAQAGMNGGFFGAVGGIIGKSVFAGAVASLVNSLTNKNKRKKRSFGETAKGALGVSLDTLFAWIFGIGTAILLFAVISGGVITRFSFMGGVAAAYLAGKSALNGGFLSRLSGSCARLFKGKVGTGGDGSGFVRGMSVGFALGAFFGLLNINLVLIIVGASLAGVGLILTILQKIGVIKMGKEAAKQ